MKWQHQEREEENGPGGKPKHNPFQSLRVPFLLIVAFAIISTSLAIYLAHGRSLEESLYAQTEDRIHNYRDTLQNFLDKRLDTLLSHSRNLTGRQSIRQELHHLLRNPQQTTSAYALNQQLDHIDYDFGLSNVSLLDKQGQLIFSHGLKTRNFAKDSNILSALKGHEFSDLIKDGDNWLIRAAVPVQVNNSPIGVLILTKELSEFLTEFSEINQIRLALADKQGIQMSDNTSTEPIAFNIKKVEQVLDENTEQTSINLQRNRLTHYMDIQIGEHLFVLISQTGLGPISAIVKQKKKEVLQLTLLLLTLLLPLSAWLVHLLLRQLIVLRKRAASMTEKLAGISLAEYQGNEINQLIHTFDGMASALEKHETARQNAEALLQQEHATLEYKIKERTKELEKANDLLLHEISDRTRTQKKTEALQKFMSSLIDAMPSVLIGIDHNCRINQWNHEAEKICGLSFSQVSGLNVIESLPWLEKFTEKIEHTLKTGIQTNISHFHWTHNDGDRLVDILINPISSEQQGGAVIQIDDVTERVRFDERIMQTEKMISIGGLAAGMAHEINNPLASILQNAQVVTQRISPNLDKNRNCAEMHGFSIDALNIYCNERQITKMLGSIIESGQRIGEIVNNIGKFSQENELFQSKQKVADLHSIAEILDLAVEQSKQDYNLKKKYNIHQVEFNRQYPMNIPQVFCTADQLTQVFFNLIQNAVQAMSIWSGMSRPPQIDLSIRQKGQMLSIDIRDNGPGIDSDIQKRIFEPFFTTKEVGQGTGLGLSVCYFIITENHHGQISVSSTPGEGTCFHILLPFQMPAKISSV